VSRQENPPGLGEPSDSTRVCSRGNP
jgi:hypothetical protein